MIRPPSSPAPLRWRTPDDDASRRDGDQEAECGEQDPLATRVHQGISFATRDIPTVNFGPGAMHVAHGPDEWVSVADYLDAIEVLTITTMRWCGVRT